MIKAWRRPANQISVLARHGIGIVATDTWTYDYGVNLGEIGFFTWTKMDSDRQVKWLCGC